MKKRGKVREVVLRRLWLKDSWVIFFALGFATMNFPFLCIFNKPLLVFDVPLLYLYLMTGWAASLVVAYLFSRAQERRSEERRG